MRVGMQHAQEMPQEVQGENLVVGLITPLQFV
jgi:hypothetical protein